MAPYIAALVLLIVVILISVYKSTDGFTGYVVNDTMTFQAFMDTLSSSLKKNKDLKLKLDNSPNFEDEITRVKANELGFDVIPTQKPFSKALSTQMETDTKLISMLIDIFNMNITAGSINPTDILKDVAKKNTQIDSIVKVLPRIVDVINAREEYINAKLAAAKTSASDASGSSVPITSTTVDLEDIYSAIAAYKESNKPSTIQDVDLTKRSTKIDSIKAEAPETSVASTKEMEERIAKNVATQVKDSLLAQRSLQNGMEDANCPYASFDSTATSQGQEYTQTKPDMSQYIRKDSIPCWNCSLP
jgi:hypothetical protein